jgi:hypothetical protein
MNAYNTPPTIQQLENFDPNLMAQTEAVKWNIYDTLAYATTGQQSLTFFQSPVGQNGKTYADTNMLAGGALPNPQQFLVTGIEIYFRPGTAVSTVGAPAVNEYVIDTEKFWNAPAWLAFQIASKNYLNESPLLKFPPPNGLAGWAAMSDSTTAGAGQNGVISYATACGECFEMNPPILLTTNTNFSITLNWPALITLTTAATVKVNLSGLLYRASQ